MQTFAFRASCGFLLAASFCIWGCAVERPKSRAERKEIKQQETEFQSATPKLLPPPSVDEAQLVMNACGTPQGDSARAIFDKMHNGPVRFLRYGGSREIVLEFIPSRPTAHPTDQPAPLPHSPSMRADLPPGSVWEFTEAHVDQRELLTSTRLGIYLPCAGQALSQRH